MADDQPGDVRDTLSELERKLRELEGDLRGGAGAGAGVQAGAGAGVQAGAGAQGQAGAGAGAGDGSGGADSPAGGSGGGSRLPWLITALSALLLATVLIVVIATRGDPADSASQAAASGLAVAPAVAGSEAAVAIAKLGGVRAARGDAAAEACVGTAAAALVIVRPQPTTVGCAGLQEVLAVTVNATALAQRGGARSCLAARRIAARVRGANNSLTRRRAEAQATAATKASARAKAADSDSATLIRAQRSAQARAGTNFDRNHRLRLAAARDRSGDCVAPLGAALRDGRYPLSERIALLARPDSLADGQLQTAIKALRKAFGGAVPVEVAVSGG